MPERGLGRALRKALAGEKEEALPPKGEALLLNEPRRRILEFLCERPCLTPGAAARALNLSPNAVAWHVEKLQDAGYLAAASGDAAYPAGLLPPGDVALFSLLAQDTARGTLVAVFAQPGRTQEEVADHVGAARQTVSRALGELERSGLISVVRDGRVHRYFPTPLLAKRREANAKRALAFSDAVLARLQAERVAPQVLRRNAGEILVRLGDQPRAPFLHLRTDPYAALLG